MELLINLLERKNLCYRSFYQICNDFMDEISAGKLENLEKFQKRRQGLLNVLEQLDFEITHLLDGYKERPGELEALLTGSTRTKINQLYSEKDGYIKSIMDLDSKILWMIEREKDETLKKLQSIQVGRKTLGAYRSPMETVEQAENSKILDSEV